MNMRILLLVPLSSALVAQTANMRVVSITPQQAVIQYACPDAAPATLTVSDDSGLGVTVWDVSGAKFQNSDSDLGRANTITWQSGPDDNGTEPTVAILGVDSSVTQGPLP